MTMDGWDFLIAGDDAEVEAEIRADAALYAKFLTAGNAEACILIENKYGLVGLPTEKVSQTLAEMILGPT